MIGILFLGSIAAIFVVTLMSRMEKAEALAPTMIPFASYMEVLNGGNPEILRSNFMNVLLFYPSGFLAAVLFPRKWHPVLTILLVCIVFAGISMGIEYCQYARTLGQAEMDDVIHNTLGALIGSVTGYCLCRRSA
ncbi:MAG: VanZ family protein [Clostridia bacterium]|nr:VanZ family protein [Clostridia bacterium]